MARIPLVDQFLGVTVRESVRERKRETITASVQKNGSSLTSVTCKIRATDARILRSTNSAFAGRTPLSDESEFLSGTFENAFNEFLEAADIER